LQLKEIKDLQPFIASDNAAKGLLQLLETHDWYRDTKIVAAVKPIVIRLCAHYLLNEKKKLTALDPVAHFHLTNGARLERINWLADTSAKGIKQAAGLMVNYYYDLGDIDDNHEDYVTEGKIAASKSVRGLI
jgi:malonyl-CoA decarboxylase